MITFTDTTCLQGVIQKLKSTLHDPVQYRLPIGETEISLNDCLGKIIALKFLKITCIYCGKTIKKSYNQGYCFPCAKTLARCDLCIVKPERCHYHLGTCREPEWGVEHCFIPHILYLANTSGFKIGITRETQIPIRWIDQGAIQALPLLRIQNRYHAGLLEVALKTEIGDKTDWRKMLSYEGEYLDLLYKAQALLKNLTDPIQSITKAEILKEQIVTNIKYPILYYPQKIRSLNIEMIPEIKGTLIGIKGQYLILDIGVINIRSLTGYRIKFARLSDKP